MILQVPPGSPLVIQGAAALVLGLHIGGGLVGIGAGGVALTTPKGSRPHRLAGHVFFVAMLIMSGIGAVVSPFLPQWSNVGAGMWTFYLVATGWMAARRPAGAVGRFEVGALAFALAAVALEIGLGVTAGRRPDGDLDGAPPIAFYAAAALIATTAAADLSVILRGGISGGQRLARHLWRLGVALLVAEGSFFLGQPRIFPPAFRDTPIMFVPVVATLAYMAYWLVKLLSRRRPAGRPMRPRAPSPAQAR